MDQMSSEEPYDVETFLSEVADPKFDPLVDVLEQGIY